MNVNDNGCPFCNEFNGHKELSYFELTYGLKNKILERCLFNTELFACVPSIGSFVEGYLLLIPKKHFLSFLILPKTYLSELSLISGYINDFFMESYHMPYVVYEHGASNSDNVGGMSVVHAHLHFVPCNVSIILLCSEFDFVKFNSFVEASEYYLKYGEKCPYLLIRDIDGSIFLAISNNIPSQYFRKKVAHACGQDGKSDWKEYPFIHNIERTIVKAKNYQLGKNINNGR